MPKLKDGIWWSAATQSYHFHVRRKSPTTGLIHDLKGDTYTNQLPEAHDRKTQEADRWRRLQVGLPVENRLPTLGELHTRWETAVANTVTAHTRKVMALRLRLHFSSLLALPVDQITTQRVEAARAAYLASPKTGRATPHSKRGANKIVGSLRDLLGWAVRREILPRLPFRLEKLKDDPRVPAIVWPEQVEAYLGQLKPRALKSPRRHKQPGSELRRWDVHDCCHFMVSAGIREGECLRARWEWVDWRRHLYQVAVNKSRKLREVPLEEALEARLRERWKACGEPTEGWMFPTAEGRPHSPQFTKKAVARAGLALGIRGMTPHDLRRTFASALDELGFTKAQIMLLMGHADPATTERYILRRPKSSEEAIRGLSRAYAITMPLVCPEQSTNAINTNAVNL